MSGASNPVWADGLSSSWRNMQMVRPDIARSVNIYWHSAIQKNCREWLKIGRDFGATLAPRATSADARRLWGKKLFLVPSGEWWWGGYADVGFSPLKIWTTKVRLLRGTRASQWQHSWLRLQRAALHGQAKKSVISGLVCFCCLTSRKSRDLTSSPELSGHKTVRF